MANTITKGMWFENLKGIERPNAGTVIFSAARLKGNFEEDSAYARYNNFGYLTKQAVRAALDGKIPGLEWLQNAPMKEAAKAIIPDHAADNISITDCPADYRPMIFIAPKSANKWEEGRAFCISDGESWQLISVYVKKEDGPFTLSFTWDNSHAAYLRREAKAQGRSTYIRWDGQAVPFTVTHKGEKAENGEKASSGVKTTKGKVKNAIKAALEAINEGKFLHPDGYFLMNEETENAVRKVLVNALAKKSEEVINLEKEITSLHNQIVDKAEEVEKGVYDESVTASYDEEEITPEILRNCRLNYLKKFSKRINAKIAELETKKGTLISTEKAEEYAKAIFEDVYFSGKCPYILSIEDIVFSYNTFKAKWEREENADEEGKEEIPAA